MGASADEPTNPTIEAGASDLSLDELVELERRAAEEQAVEHSEAATVAGDDVVVLPWWQHPVNIVTMVVTAALLAGMIGWMIGDSGGRPTHNEIDTGFLQDMRVHHEQGVVMSSIYLNRPDITPGLAIVASSIMQGQTLEVGRMIQLLRDFGEEEAADLQGTAMTWMGMPSAYDAMPGMATAEQLDQLGNASGADADALFAELMTTHHLGGVHMAEFAAENAKNSETKAFAQSIVTAQQAEVAEIERELAGSQSS